MNESSTDLLILGEILKAAYAGVYSDGKLEGEVEGAKRMLRIIGDDFLGLPDARTAATIKDINELARLEELGRRLFSVRSWQELLDQPTAKPRRRRARQPPKKKD